MAETFRSGKGGMEAQDLLEGKLHGTPTSSTSWASLTEIPMVRPSRFL